MDQNFLSTNKGLEEAIEKISSNQARIKESLQPVLNQYAKIISVFENDAVGFSQALADANEIIFKIIKPLNNHLLEVSKISSIINRVTTQLSPYAVSESVILWSQTQDGHRFLHKHGWAITPFLKDKTVTTVLLSPEIKKKSNQEINELIQNFFESNNFRELELMIESWQVNDVFKDRIKIFENCLALLRLVTLRGAGVNLCVIMIPTLIAQIDGILLSCARKRGYGLKKTYIIDRSSVKEKVHKSHVSWMDDLSAEDGFSVYAYMILFDCLFKTAYPAGQIYELHQKLEKPSDVRPNLQYNRHKIMHGEDLNYGTPDNLLRTFLMLDFLANT